MSTLYVKEYFSKIVGTSIKYWSDSTNNMTLTNCKTKVGKITIASLVQGHVLEHLFVEIELHNEYSNSYPGD